MDLKENCRYALASASSMGVRLCAPEGQPIHSSNTFRMQATSAESNVLSVASYLGMRTKLLTVFVENSPISQFIKQDLRSRNIEFEGTDKPQGGPWGLRHQFNLADSGYGVRGPVVYNDRAGEAGRTIGKADFDLEKLFHQDGVQILHLSGLLAALSPESGRFCLELAKYAKKSGTKISFDLNYRATFWKDRKAELRDIFNEIACASDLLAGNEEDFQLCLGVAGPDTGGGEAADKIEHFREMIANAKKRFINVSVFVTTLRQVKSANCHLWGAIMCADEEWHVAQPREITVLDRIGGGDSFVGGLLYAIAKGYAPEQWLQFGWASGAMATTLLTDYIQPMGEQPIWDIWQGNARVKR